MASTTRPARSCSRASVRNATGRRGPTSPGALNAAMGRIPTVMNGSVRQHVPREVIDRRVRRARENARHGRQHLENFEVVVDVDDPQAPRAEQAAIPIADREHRWPLELEAFRLELDLDVV